jgi:hypothetical protein
MDPDSRRCSGPPTMRSCPRLGPSISKEPRATKPSEHLSLSCQRARPAPWGISQEICK